MSELLNGIMTKTKDKTKNKYSRKQVSEILNDYKLACTSRHMSILGRKEVLTGKAKFGIFGDGKELPQLAMAKFFRNGDFRSGYYRDQTFMMAIDWFIHRRIFLSALCQPRCNERSTFSRQADELSLCKPSFKR